jgi:hypothetical protein
VDRGWSARRRPPRSRSATFAVAGPGPSADRRDVPPGRAGCRIRDRSSRTSALIEGPELKHLLAEQLGLDVRVGLDRPRPVAALDAASRNSRGRAMSGLLGSPMRCWYLARTWAIAPMKETHPCLEPRYGDRGPPRPAPPSRFYVFNLIEDHRSGRLASDHQQVVPAGPSWSPPVPRRPDPSRTVRRLILQRRFVTYDAVRAVCGSSWLSLALVVGGASRTNAARAPPWSVQ